MAEPAVFVDRDGTLNVEVGHLDDAADLDLIDGAGEALRTLRGAGYRVVVITNQSAVARGLLTEDALRDLHARLARRLGAEGARLDGIYYCPHHPTEGRGPYRVECSCRKPKPGLVERAARELDIDLERSFVVGDKLSDLEAGARAGCRGVLVRTGYGADEEQRLDGSPVRPAHVADDLLAASRWIAGRSA
jgi:D-glycero-D-manno-heptose 1,7-bisphosphate phosphatase